MFKPIIRTFSTNNKESVVIIGTGWGGFRLLQHLDKKKYDVTVVSPRNHFVFTPLLASSAVGTIEYRCIAAPVRDFKDSATYYEGYAREIDTQKKILHCDKPSAQGKFSLKYDKLVIACGAAPNTFGTPGVYENAFFLKEIADARNIRYRVIDRFELASDPCTSEEEKAALLHFAVVGGGPTGIELSAELHDFLKYDVAKLYPKLKPYAKLSVYDVAEKILGSFDSRLREYATKKFWRDGTEIKTGTKIQEVKKDRLVLADKSEIRVGMVVWATGLTANPFITSLPFFKDKSKRLLVDQFLHVLEGENHETVKDVYALGDCATIEHYNLPQTAQVANQQANYLAKELNKYANSPAPFTYHHKGAMAYVGDYKAVLDTKEVKGRGITAWIFWRSANWTMTVSWKNKILIRMYWTITWLFGRDTSRF